MEPELERRRPAPNKITPSAKTERPSVSKEPTSATTAVTFERRTYAREVNVVIGVALLVIGLVGFVMDNLLDAHLSYIHNVIHVVSGALAVWFGVHSEAAAKRFAYIFGAFYGLLGVLGFIVGVRAIPTIGNLTEDPFLWRITPERLEFGRNDHVIHLLIGAAFVLGGLILFKRKRMEPI